MNYFLFKKDDITYDSREYGIVCGDFPPITIPQKRLTIDTIPGRNGSLISTDDCYDSYTKTLECAIKDNSNFDLSWLKGRGTLILSNESDKEYDVTIKNNIDLELIARYYRNFLINLEVQPIKKSVKEYNLSYSYKTFEFDVGGNINTSPLIEVSGTGTISITANDSTMKIIDLKSTIILDSELLIAQENNENALYKTVGDFIVLKPGTNKFQIVGDLSNIKIIYKEAYL